MNAPPANPDDLPVLHPASALARPEPCRIRDAFRRSFALVWRALRGLGVDASSVDDATQQVFLVLARRLDDVPAGKERAFLLQAAVRQASNCRRGQRRQREAPSGHLDEQGTCDSDPEQLLQRKQRLALLEGVLDALPDDLRSVFVLFELEGLSSPEIAALLEIPRGTVVSRLRRARDVFSTKVEELRVRLSNGEST